jgi:hypothetical protein
MHDVVQKAEEGVKGQREESSPRAEKERQRGETEAGGWRWSFGEWRRKA